MTIKRSILLVLFMTWACNTFGEDSNASRTSIERSDLNKLLGDFSEVKGQEWVNWGLREEEWQRYEYILEKTPWGHWEGHVTPIQVLAIYSSSLQEKRRYARIEAKLDTWREDVVLEYQNIYNQEREIVFAQYASYLKGRRPVIDNVRPTDQLAFFTASKKCEERCKFVMGQLMESGAKVDIYFVGVKEKNHIFEWAAQANIPVERVKTKNITLNFNKGQFESVSKVPSSFADLPAAFMKSDDGAYMRLVL